MARCRSASAMAGAIAIVTALVISSCTSKMSARSRSYLSARRRLFSPLRDGGDKVVHESDITFVRSQHLVEIGMELIVTHAWQHFA
jgi:hypothetical protein